MLIKELLENANFKELAYVKQHGDKRELDYDLIEDLLHFMHNDDRIYRRHVFPVLVKCLDLVNAKKPVQATMFAEAIKECYKQYKEKFPIRELHDELEEKMCKEACSKMHDDIQEHIQAGKYKGI